MGASKKEHILQVAVVQFSQKGYDATTLEEIAGECGVTKPAIYYHFRDKAALYEAVVCSQFGIVAEQIENATQNGKAVERMRMYIVTFGKYLISNPSFNAIFAREIAGGASTLPNKCTKILSRTLHRLIMILQAGREEGVFGRENPFMLQLMIVATLTSYNTTKPLRERIVESFDTPASSLEPHFENVIGDLTEKIIKALTC